MAQQTQLSELIQIDFTLSLLLMLKLVTFVSANVFK